MDRMLLLSGSGSIRQSQIWNNHITGTMSLPQKSKKFSVSDIAVVAKLPHVIYYLEHLHQHQPSIICTIFVYLSIIWHLWNFVKFRIWKSLDLDVMVPRTWWETNLAFQLNRNQAYMTWLSQVVWFEWNYVFIRMRLNKQTTM